MAKNTHSGPSHAGYEGAVLSADGNVTYIGIHEATGDEVAAPHKGNGRHAAPEPQQDEKPEEQPEAEREVSVLKPKRGRRPRG